MDNSNPAQIQTIILDRPTLCKALEKCLRIGTEGEFDTVEVMFGYAWAFKFHDWEVLELPWSDVMDQVLIAEERGFGSIGEDDLWLTVGEDEFLFCHERDIHFPAEPVTETGKRMCEYLRTLGCNPATIPRT